MLAVDVVFKALAKAMPERISASTGGDIDSIMLYGDDPETGRSFVEANNEGVGWGATNERDSPNTLMHYAQTMVRNIPIEVFETKAPVESDKLSLRQDTGGSGENRGGLGIRRDYCLTHPTNVLLIVKKTKTEGWGLRTVNLARRTSSPLTSMTTGRSAFRFSPTTTTTIRTTATSGLA